MPFSLPIAVEAGLAIEYISYFSTAHLKEVRAQSMLSHIQNLDAASVDT